MSQQVLHRRCALGLREYRTLSRLTEATLSEALDVAASATDPALATLAKSLRTSA